MNGLPDSAIVAWLFWTFVYVFCGLAVLFGIVSMFSHRDDRTIMEQKREAWGTPTFQEPPNYPLMSGLIGMFYTPPSDTKRP